MYILDEPGVRKDMTDLIELGFPLKKKFDDNQAKLSKEF